MLQLLHSRSYVACEFMLLCVALPSYIIFSKSAPFMFAFLWGAALYCFVILRVCYYENLCHIWRWSSVNWANCKPMLIRLACASVLMIGFVYLYDPERLFFLVQERPLFLPILMGAYPVLSALPQELIFCSFFFMRYGRYFGHNWGMITASAVTFAYAHMLYLNPIAPSLSLLGGFIFAHTYWKSQSLALVTIEHGLYGNVMFITGLGWYFYSGAVAAG